MKGIKKGSKWVYWCAFAIAILVIYKILDSFTGIGIWLGSFIKVVKPFLIAILVAYLLYIPCRNIEKLYSRSKILKKRARGLAIATTYIIVALLLALLINTLLPMLSESIMDLAEHLPGYYESAIEYIDNLPDDSLLSKELIQDTIKKLQEIDLTKLFDLENIAMYIDKVVGLASGLFSIFVTIVVSIYILLERTEIMKFIRKLNSALFNEKRCKTINKYFDRGNEIFFKYISSQVLDAIMVAIIMSVALAVMRVKYALLLGFIIGLFNLIPYFGAIVAVIITALITIFTGGFTQAIWVVIVLIILQQIDANIINPKIIGDALEMSRILIIFAVTVGGAYFKVIGMFLGVPVIAVIKMMLDDYIERNENTKISTE